MVCAASIVCGIVAGVTIGAGSYAIAHAGTDRWNWRNFGISSVAGGVFGGIGAGVSKVASRFVGRGIPKYETQPQNLTQQLVLQEAIPKGTPIMGAGTGKMLSDPRIISSVWTKMQYVRSSGGVQYTVHYLQNTVTRMSKQIKFSDARSIPIK